MQNLPTEKKQQIPVYYQAEDEISLVDIWIIFEKNKKIFVKVFATFIILSILAVFIVPQKYEYTATVEIGSIHTFTNEGVTTVLIDDPETVIQKLNNAYIPSVISEYINNNPDVSLKEDSIKAELPRKAQLVILKAKGYESEEGMYVSLINYVVQKLKADHDKLFKIAEAQIDTQLTKNKLELDSLSDPNTLAIRKSGIENQIKQEENDLKKLDDELELLNKQKGRINQLAGLLSQEVKKLNSDIEKAQQQKREAVKTVGNESRAMTLLMIDNEIRHSRNRLLDTEERLNIKLENDRQALDNQIKANRRTYVLQQKKVNDSKNELIKLTRDYKDDVLGQQQKVSEIETRLKNMKQTHAIVPAYRSIESVGIGKKRNLILIGFFLGFIFATMAVFFKEFIKNVRDTEKKLTNN